MPTEVVMPSLGESVVEGTITRWLKGPGERVEEYEPLLEVNTDKVDSEIPSPAAGVVLEILVPEGTTINAGTRLAWIGEPEEQAPGNGKGDGEGASAKTAKPERQAEPARTAVAKAPEEPAAESKRDLGFISPVVSRIAGEHQVDLHQVKGTGLGGRITKKDVLAYIEQRGTIESKTLVREGLEREPATPTTPPQAPPAPAPSLSTAETAVLPGEIMPLNAVRRAIAEHMVHSKHTSPHVTTVMEADLSRVVRHRTANKETFARDGANLTFTAYFIAAIVAALKAFPLVNSSWSQEGILLHKEVNIGMATSLGEAGLIVPVIKNADTLSLLGLSRAINDLANRARSRQLKPDEVKGGTFTITNHGTSGSLFATPIINQPQCGILGVGAVQKRVVVVDDAIAIRPMVYVSLTFDHRILDGAMADGFLGKVVEYLQNWQG